MTSTISLTQIVAAPRERVWAALTTPELMAEWWVAGDIAPEVGHRFALDMGNFGQQQCEVIEVVPGELITYTFGEGTLNTTITWRLSEDPAGTRIDFEHGGFDTSSQMGAMAFGGMSGGWPAILAKIEPATK